MSMLVNYLVSNSIPVYTLNKFARLKQAKIRKINHAGKHSASDCNLPRNFKLLFSSNQNHLNLHLYSEYLNARALYVISHFLVKF